jgi:hypothetical protein
MRLRRALRSLILTASFFLVAGGVQVPSDAEPEHAQRIHFDYGIVGRIAGVDDSLFAVQDSCKLRSGDEINITVRKAVAAFFYVVLHLSNGDYSLFHVANAAESDGESTESLRWLRLDDEEGTETIHLIASQHPLAVLEQRFAAYASARGAQRAALEESIDQELQSIQTMGQTTRRGTMIPLARLAKRSSIGWNYRGPFEEHNLSQYLLTSCSGDSIVFDVVRIIHQ